MPAPLNVNDPVIHRLLTSGVRAAIVFAASKFGYDLATEQVNEIVGWVVVGVGIAASLLWSVKAEKKREETP